MVIIKSFTFSSFGKRNKRDTYMKQLKNSNDEISIAENLIYSIFPALTVSMILINVTYTSL